MADETNAKTETPARPGWPTWAIGIILLFAFGVVAFVLYSGNSLSKMSLGDLLEMDFTPKAANATPVASRDFVLGTWQLQISPQGSDASNGTSITYNSDGTLSGNATEFVNNQGQQEMLSGNWTFEKLSDSEFRLHAVINGQPYDSRFRIFDGNHIQNEDQNYVAVRMP